MKRVVYVDDDPIFRAMVERILRRRDDLEVLVASDSDEAIALVHDHGPDLLISDLRLGGADAADMVQHLRADAATRELPVLIVSGDSDQSTADRLFAAGADAYLAKPFEFSELLSTVDRLLAEGSGLGASAAPLAAAPPAGAPASDAVLDEGAIAALHGLIDSSPDGGELLSSVTRNLAGHVQRIHTALDRDDTEAAGAAAHSLAGSAGLCGAMGLGLLARDVQDHLAAGADVQREIEELDNQLASVLEALREEFPVLRERG